VVNELDQDELRRLAKERLVDLRIKVRTHRSTWLYLTDFNIRRESKIFKRSSRKSSRGLSLVPSSGITVRLSTSLRMTTITLAVDHLRRWYA
jgi:hypothetical protein